MFNNFDAEGFVIGIIVIVLSISLHEFGHAYAADRLGDDTPRRQGRVTLWPDKHFDPMGFLFIVITQLAGFGIGWGKPVQVDFRNFRNVRRDDIIVTAAGPLMNLILATIFGLILRFGMQTQSPLVIGTLFGKFALYFLLTNLGLMFFNLLPIYPLDGSHILRRLLPPDLGERYYTFIMQWGPLFLMIACFSGSGILGRVVGPAVMQSAMILLGRG